MLKEEKLTRILVRPLMTEKSERAISATKGACIVFEVSKGATKMDVAAAVSFLFRVDALKIRILNVKERYKNKRKRQLGIRVWRKAYVSLAPGQAQAILEARHGIV